MKRVFLIVLDSCGIGEMPDAADFGDVGSNTLAAAATSPCFHMPNMARQGLFNIDGVTVGDRESAPLGAFARLAESSKGKDTTIGHWEIAGVASPQPMPTFPEGFPQDFLDAFSAKVGRGVLCNRPYSGTKVIADYGQEHLRTGDLIVYTSADSVLQIAAHEEIVPLEELYDICRTAREMLTGPLAVGRVIARPFVGEPGNFTRSANRHDFSLEPPKKTMLDHILDHGKQVLAVGKIRDIFAGKGIGEYVFSQSNEDGVQKLLAYMDRDFEGLCFTNLVDFDMLYGHRNDVDGYAKALSAFDAHLPQLLAKLGPEDVLMVTADHGCDPATASTDHSREYIPLVVMGEPVRPGANAGTRASFADIAATILDYLDILAPTDGKSMRAQLFR